MHVQICTLQVDIEAYNMSSATMVEVHGYYVLRVPGLAEKRPSLIVGDTVLAGIPGIPAYFEVNAVICLGWYFGLP